MSIRIAGIDRLRRWVDQHRGQPLSLTPEQAEVIYRLVEHVPAWRAWIAEKPD